MNPFNPKLLACEMTVKTYIDTVSILRHALESGRGTKYKRLASALELCILDGSLAAGSKLTPQRILAYKLNVTVGTVSRAYAELERMGLVVPRVGDGTFVRQRGLERKRDEGYRNVAESPAFYDMSRNLHIPGAETSLLAQSLMILAQDVSTLGELMTYTPEVGLPRFRAAGAKWLSSHGFRAHPEQVLCTNGSQHALLCTLMALLRPGDTLVTEPLTYPGLISAARLLGIRLLAATMDDDGLLPHSLDELCRLHRVTALYCTPTLQNPTTSILPTERRQAIATICREHNLLIIEDETHAVLLEDRPAPLSHFVPERSILIGGMSKAVAAGLRVGYLHAPVAMVSRLAAALRGSCWMATPLPLELATRWIDDGTAQILLQQQAAEIARRKALVTQLLEGLNYRTHSRSPHFWIQVPEPWRASDVESDLAAKHYRIATAESFAVGHAAVPQFVRVSICDGALDDVQLCLGFQALSVALDSDTASTERS